VIDLSLKSELLIELARREFWTYCQLMDQGTADPGRIKNKDPAKKLKKPLFFKDDRAYLRKLADELEDFYRSDDEVMTVSLPPRHGKTRTVTNFSQWVFGQNPSEKIMTGSYNEMISTAFSKAVRNKINEEKIDPSQLIYSDIFPDVQIQRGDGAVNYWSLQGEYSSYLATSPGGSATGLGCSLLIIDDLIKNDKEALNDSVLEGHWDWFTKTMYNRLEEGGKILIIATRWSKKDLIGQALTFFREEEGKRVREIVMSAKQDDGSMLCDEILSRGSYDSKVRAMGTDLGGAVFDQKPIDIKGRLYTGFRTYETPPDQFDEIKAYIDTADEGKDYLAGFVYGTYEGEAYILDTIYTKKSMEFTEPATADLLYRNAVNYALIESNNGGRGFARSVERLIFERYKTKKVVVDWFFQNENKKARILSGSTFVLHHIYFPWDWEDRWPDLAKDLKAYQKDGRNQVDDGPDALTGVAENVDVRSAKIRVRSTR